MGDSQMTKSPTDLSTGAIEKIPSGPCRLLGAGALAPNFTLNVTPDQALSLHDLRGRPVILAFYPADWSPVCGDQMGLYNEILPEFHKFGAELLSISVDGPGVTAPYKPATFTSRCYRILNPKAARQYGAYRASDGVCERALFVIDKSDHRGTTAGAVNPGAEGIAGARGFGDRGR
jgi:peroxiredoxin